LLGITANYYKRVARADPPEAGVKQEHVFYLDESIRGNNMLFFVLVLKVKD
jgi:hypothetical protein